MLDLRIKKHRPLLVSVGIFITIFCACLYFISLSNTNFKQNQRLLLSGMARSQAAEIERNLSLSLTSTQILAHQISIDYEKVNHFESYAQTIMQSFEGISSIQLAPEGIIRYIYPLQGNESALGLDILNHPKYGEAAQLAIAERRMIVIGPVKLVQGDIAVISRTPIFTKTSNGNEQFWGFASALIMLTPLLEKTGIHQLEEEGYTIQIQRRHTDSKQTFDFYQSPTELDKNAAVEADITLPTGAWTLTLSHNITSVLHTRTLNMLFVALLLSSICSLSLYNILIRPIRLQKEVNAKTLELKELAFKDPLTGLPNRRFLNDHFPNIIKEIVANKSLGAFIYFDLDNFKSINDTIGHDVGDQMLASIADRLERNKDHDDIVLRLGGDEFAIIVPSLVSHEELKRKAEAILHNTQQSLSIRHRDFKQSTSLGITLIPDHGTQVLELMQYADVALYEAKRRGKNQYVIFDDSMHKQSVDTHNEEMALARALERDELVLHFQPQFDLSLNKIVGAEALVRWQHPDKGLVYPDSFIPLAEQSGQILALGNRVIEKSFEYLAYREALGLYPILLHINLSSLQLNDPNLVPFVKSMVQTYNIPGHYIGFEITETTLLTDINHAKETLEELKSLGICIAIDDFGTGFSSLGQLKNLPVDLLKIDRSFVWDLERDKDDRMIVEAIIAMAHKLDIMVIAEGVESNAQLNMLREFHCDLGQGYFISRPIPQEQFNDFPESITLNDLLDA